MNNYIDFSVYSGQDIKKMLREKQKEYIILIQSEKIAKKVLNKYNECLYPTEYHNSLNKEYYMLYETARKKQAITSEEINDINVLIPIDSIIRRLEENYFLLKSEEKKELYERIINDFSTTFNGVEILYENGFLYYITDNKKVILNDELFDNILNGKEYTYTKTK